MAGGGGMGVQVQGWATLEGGAIDVSPDQEVVGDSNAREPSVRSGESVGRGLAAWFRLNVTDEDRELVTQVPIDTTQSRMGIFLYYCYRLMFAF